ncbi:MAG: hypothetical protein QXK94_07210 [Candidatus Jordarchaeales archaeon]
MSSEIDTDKLVSLVETNIGRWKPLAVAIVDINNKIWGERGGNPRRTPRIL